MTTVYLGLGSNLGDRLGYLQTAAHRVARAFLSPLRVSSIYESAPHLGKDQPHYLNSVVGGQTQMDPIELLQFCAQIEKSLGRNRNEKWESRTIDIDILYFGQDIIELPELSIPHYDIKNRGFFLFPLCELDADWLDPQLNCNMTQLTETWKSINTDNWPALFRA